MGFMIMKLKYILATLLIEYSTLRIYLMILLIKCVTTAKIELEWFNRH